MSSMQIPLRSELHDQGQLLFDDAVPGMVISCYEGINCCLMFVEDIDHTRSVAEMWMIGKGDWKLHSPREWTRDSWNERFQHNDPRQNWKVQYIPPQDDTFQRWVKEAVTHPV